MNNNDSLIGKFELFLLTHARYATNTCIAYSRDIHQFAQYLSKNELLIEALQRDDIKSYMNFLYHMGLAAASRARKVETLRTFFGFLADHCGLPAYNNHVYQLNKIKFERKLPETLTEKEVRSLLKAADKDILRNRVLIYLLYGSGVRINELLQLQKKDISYYPPLLRVMGKAQKERLIPYPHVCIRMIKDHSKSLQSEYIFESWVNDQWQPLSRAQACYILRQLAKKAKLTKKVYPHLFRHSYATHMLVNGANIRQIQTILGHERISSTQIYTNLDMTQLRKEYNKKNIRA